MPKYHREQETVTVGCRIRKDVLDDVAKEASKEGIAANRTAEIQWALVQFLRSRQAPETPTGSDGGK